MSSQNITKNSELLPCPFCGGKAETIHQSFDAFFVICHSCYTTGKTYNTEAEAIAAWDTRAELGSGTCEWNLSEKWPNAKGDDYVYGYETECGCRHTWWPDTLPSYCPSCGKKVKVGE